MGVGAPLLLMWTGSGSPAVGQAVLGGGMHDGINAAPTQAATVGWAPGQETAVQPSIVSVINCAVSRSRRRPGMGARPHYRDEGSQEEVTPTWKFL